MWCKQNLNSAKVIMQGKLFQRCKHLLYCSVLSLGDNVNTRRMSQPCHNLTWDPSFRVKKQWNILVIENYYVNYQNLMLLSSPYTKRTLMHLFLFTNSVQRELVSIYVRRVFATAINFPCIITLNSARLSVFFSDDKLTDRQGTTVYITSN